jgi:uncharacterized protein
MNNMVVLGASPNPDRFSYKAVKSLLKHNFNVVAVGLRPGLIDNFPIQTGQPPIDDVHTILLYVGTEKQKEYYKYILHLKPKRIIFNPGTENYELAQMARDKGIEVVFDCYFVMKHAGQF